MPRGEPSVVVALRLTPADRDRLLTHGRHPGEAVRALLDASDGTVRPPKPVKAASTRAKTVAYVVSKGGVPIFRTAVKGLAVQRMNSSPGSVLTEVPA